MKRVFLVVLDSLGVGELPDAEKFGDKDCNTLKRISDSLFFYGENSIKMGIGNIDGVDFLPSTEKPIAAYGKLAEKSAGKDTTTGHWEIAGIVSEKAMPTFPDGFPEEILSEFSRITGRGVLCNKPYSGTEVIKDFGEEHMKTGDLIVYTSADSVFQIAAHESVVPVETLYEYCVAARKMLVGDLAVGRVIARPFTGKYPNFTRTSNRRDFSLEPPSETLLDAVKGCGKSVTSVGKISDIFAGRGITEKIATHSNSEGIAVVEKMLETEFEGLCFVNLVDFDMLYGHRQDVDGYATAFAEFDKKIPSFFSKMKKNDVLIITADHGCDPGDGHTDHTREYIPILVYGENIKPVSLGIRNSFSDIAAFISDYLGVSYSCGGESFYDSVTGADFNE